MRELMGSLREGVSKAKKLYVDTNRIPQEVFDELVAADTTANKKYIEWMCKMYVRERPNMDRFSIIATFADLVARNIVTGEETDINRYRNLEALDDKVRQHEGQMTKSEIKRGVKNFENIPKEDIAFENDKVVVVLPKTTEASQKYGRGTRWCTAAMGQRNYFEDYRFRRFVNLYYLLPKIELGELMGLGKVTATEGDEEETKDQNRKYDKIAVAVNANGSKEYYDYFDSHVSEETFKRIRKLLGIK